MAGGTLSIRLTLREAETFKAALQAIAAGGASDMATLESAIGRVAAAFVAVTEKQGIAEKGAAANAAAVQRAALSYEGLKERLDPVYGALANYQRALDICDTAVERLKVSEVAANAVKELSLQIYRSTILELSGFNAALGKAERSQQQQAATVAKAGQSYASLRNEMFPLEGALATQNERLAVCTAAVNNNITTWAGVAPVVAKVRAAYAETVAELDGTAEALRRNTAEVERNAAKSAAIVSSFRSLQGSLDPAAAAWNTYNDAVRIATAATGHAGITQDDTNRAIAMAKSVLDATLSSLTFVTAAMEQNAAAAAKQAAGVAAISARFDAWHASIDPVFRSEQQLAAAEIELAAAVDAGTRSKEAAAAIMAQLRANHAQVVRSTETMANAESLATEALRLNSAAVAANTANLAAARAGVDPIYAAIVAYERAVVAATTAVAADESQRAQANATLAAAYVRYMEVYNAVSDTAKAEREAAAAAVDVANANAKMISSYTSTKSSIDHVFAAEQTRIKQTADIVAANKERHISDEQMIVDLQQVEAAYKRATTEQISHSHSAANGTAVNSNAIREFIVISHEALIGTYSRIPGSLMVLAEMNQNLFDTMAGVAKRVGSIIEAIFSLRYAAITATAALVGMSVAAIVAHESHISKLNELAQHLRGTHDDYVTLAHDIEASAKRAAASISGLNRKDAKSAAEIIGSTPEFATARANMDVLLQLATDLAKVMGKTAPEAAKELALAFRDPGTEAKKLADEGLKAVGYGLAKYIADIQAGGDKSAATAKLIAALTAAVGGASKPVNDAGEALDKLSKSFEKLKQQLGPILEAVGGAMVVGLTFVVDRLERLVNRIEAVRAQIKLSDQDAGRMERLFSGPAPNIPIHIPTGTSGPVTSRGDTNYTVSNFPVLKNPDSTATGMFQLLDGTASDLGVNSSDYTQNIKGGIKRILQAWERWNGIEADVAQAYFQGDLGLENIKAGRTSTKRKVDASYYAQDVASRRAGDVPEIARQDIIAEATAQGANPKQIDFALRIALKESGGSHWDRTARRESGPVTTTTATATAPTGAVYDQPPAPSATSSDAKGLIQDAQKLYAGLHVFDETHEGLERNLKMFQAARAELDKITPSGVALWQTMGEEGVKANTAINRGLQATKGALYASRDPVETLLHSMEQQASSADVASGATRELAKTDQQLNEAAKAMGLTGASQEQLDRGRVLRLKELDAGFRDQMDAMDRATAGNDRLTASLAAGGAETVTLTHRIKAEEEARKTTKEGSAEYETKVTALTAKLDKQSAALANETTQRATLNTNLGTQYIEAEITTLGMDADKRALVLTALKAEIEAKKTLQKLSPEVAQQSIDAAVRQTAAQQKLAKETQVSADIASEMTSIFTTVGSSITDAFVKGSAAGVNFKTVLQGIGTQLGEWALKISILNPLLNAMDGQKLTTLSGVAEKIGGNVDLSPTSWGTSILGALGLASTAEDKPTTSIGGDLITNSGTSLTNGSAIINTTNNTLVSGSGTSSSGAKTSSTGSSLLSNGSSLLSAASSGSKLMGVDWGSVVNSIDQWGVTNLGTGLSSSQAAFVAGEVPAAEMAGTTAEMSSGSLSGIAGTVGTYVAGWGIGFGAGTLAGSAINPGHNDQAMVGAAAGATIGMVFGPIGSAIGGLIGGIAGSFFGPGAAHNGWGYHVSANESGQLVTSDEHYNNVAKEQWTADMSAMAKVNAYLTEHAIVASGTSIVGGNNTGVAGEQSSFQDTAKAFTFSSATGSAALKQVLANNTFTTWDDLAAGVQAAADFDKLTGVTVDSIGTLQTSINSVNTSFDAATVSAVKYGLSEDVLNTKRAASIKALNDAAAATVATERASMAARVNVANDNAPSSLVTSLATAAASAKTEMLSFMGTLTTAFGSAYATTAEYADLVAQLTRTQVAERQKIIRDFAAKQAQGLNDWTDALTGRLATVTGNSGLVTSSSDAATFRDQIVTATSALKELGLSSWQTAVQIDALMAVQAAEAANNAYTTARSAYETALNSAISANETAASSATTLATSLRTAAEALTKFAAGLFTSAASPLTPEQKLAAARTAMAASAATASDTSVDAAKRTAAASQLQTDATTRLTLAESYYGKAGPGYAAEFEAVQKALTAASAAMVDTASPQEQQVKLLGEQLTVLKAQLAAVQAMGAVAPATLDALKALTDSTYAAKLAADQRATGATALASDVSGTAQAATAAQLVGPQPVSSVTQAYQEMFGRAPDAAGLTYWQGQLATGGVTLSTLERAMAGTDEYKSRATTTVTAIYRSALGRAPDAEGLAFWVAMMQSGASSGEVLRGIQSTAEYKSTHGMAAGGWVGNGVWNKDSVIAAYAGGGTIGLAGGEYVVNASQAARYADVLPGMNAGSYRANDNQAVVVELRAVRAELAALRRAQAAATQVAAQGHIATVQAVQENTTVAQQAAGSAKRLAAR
jgi:hypothetical protein